MRARVMPNSDALSSSPPGLTRWSMLTCSLSAAENLNQLHRRMDCRIKSGNDERKDERKKGSGTPADAVVQVPHASGVRGAPRKGGLRRPSACGRARLPAFHHGSRQRESSSLRLSLGQASWDLAGALDPVRPPQPGGGDLAQLKRALHPPRPVPVQRSTSHAGRNAGRHDAQAARERS